MASIKGVNLKAIKKTIGIEGEGFLANIYLQNKKIGTVTNYGDGGCYHICIEKEERVLEDIVRTYYKEHPELDNFALKSVEEYLERKENGTLPLRNFSDTDIYILYEYFLSKVYRLHCLEKEFTNAVKKGYTALVTISYVYIPGSPLPLDEMYYTDGTKNVFNEICQHAKNKTFSVKQYSCLEDFCL